MKKTYLISYTIEKFQALNSGGVTHVLKLKNVWFQGLYRTTTESKFTVPEHHNYKSYTDNWDNLIKNKKPLN